MSELITNLQTIYNTKLAIKEAIGTVSDNFVDYPSYISGMVTPTGTYNISDNGTFDVSTYASAYVNVSGGGETIAQKNAAWQTKWAPALAQVAAGLYAQDPSYGEPQITSPSGWCVQTALDGNAAMSELIALDSLWIEIFGYGSNIHEQYVQIFTQMGLTLDSHGNLVSTDDDKILPFDVDEAIVTNLTGVLGLGCLGGKKISSLNGGIENTKWNYYGTVFNGTGFDYAYIGQFDCVVDQLTMVNQMQRDGVTFINSIPAVNLVTLQGYLNDFQMDGTVNPSGSLSITSNNTYDVTDKASVVVNVPSSGGVEYSIVDLSYSSFVANSKYEICAECDFNQGALDAATCEALGIDSKYVGWQLHSIRTHSLNDGPYDGLVGVVVSENTVSDSDGVYVLHLTYIQTITQGISGPFFEIDEIASVSYYGGNSSYTLTENGNYYAGKYSYLTINVPQSIGLPYDVTQSFYQLNGTTLKYIMEDSGEPKWICSLDPNQSSSFTILYYTGSNVFHGLSSALTNTIDDTNVGTGSMNNDRLSSQTSDFGAFTINNTSSKVVSISIYCHYRSNTTIDLDLSWVADEPKE